MYILTRMYVCNVCMYVICHTTIFFFNHVIKVRTYSKVIPYAACLRGLPTLCLMAIATAISVDTAAIMCAHMAIATAISVDTAAIMRATLLGSGTITILAATATATPPLSNGTTTTFGHNSEPQFKIKCPCAP